MTDQPSAVVTGGLAVTGGVAGQTVIWLCQVIHITPPPEGVAILIGAGLLALGHAGVNWLQRRANANANTIPAPASVPATPAQPAA